MKRLQFKYTKDSGDVSERDLLVISKPSDKYFGIDMSCEGDEAIKAMFIASVKELKAEYDAKFSAVLSDFGLKDQYRQFFQSKMTQVSEV